MKVTIELPDESLLRFPTGVDARLQSLLDRQDRGIPLTSDERAEAEGLVHLAEFFSLLRFRAQAI